MFYNCIGQSMSDILGSENVCVVFVDSDTIPNSSTFPAMLDLQSGE